MKNFVKRIITIVCAMMLCVVAANAQSSGDKLYNQGLALQKTMTKSAQNQAISKFQSAKKLYDSAAKKKQCDDAIAVSRGIISSLGSGGGKGDRGSGGGSSKNSGGSKQKIEKQETREAATLTLSNKVFHPGQQASEMEVSVTTNQKEWSVAPIADRDGKSFVAVTKVDDHIFKISVPFNPGADARTQYVQVTAGSAKEKVEVTQIGREIELTANKTSIKVGKKSKTEKIDIICNSDAEYSENYGNNWRVLSAPDWVRVVGEAPKKEESKGLFGKMVDMGKDAVSKVSGSKEIDGVKSKAQIFIDPLPANLSSRDGEIVIESGYKTFRIVVIQTK